MITKVQDRQVLIKIKDKVDVNISKFDFFISQEYQIAQHIDYQMSFFFSSLQLVHNFIFVVLEGFEFFIKIIILKVLNQF